MALSVIPRKIVIKKGSGTVELHEPTPGAPIEQIRLYNQTEHPELATCGVDTETVNGVETITFKPQVGTRG